MQTVYSNIKLVMPRYRMSEIQRNTVLFQMELQTREGKWFLSKKYDEFAKLHQNLQKYHHDLPQFPEKSMLRLSYFMHDDAEEKQRLANLQSYMQGLTIRQDVVNSDFLREFLQLQKNSPGLLCKVPTLLGEFSVDPLDIDFAKGVRDFFYDQQLRVFIIITGDMNAVSRVNSYITNTKLPWEGDDIPQTLIAVGSVECWVCLSNEPDCHYQRIWSKIYPAQATSMHYCKTRERLLIGLDDGTVDELKVTSRNKYVKYQQSATFKIHEERVTGIYYQPMNRVMYTVSEDMCLITCDMSNYFKMHSTVHHFQLVTLMVDATNKRLFIGANQGHIFVYEYSNKIPAALFTIITPEEGPIKSMALDLVKNYLFTAGYQNGMVGVFDIDKPGREKFTKQIACMEGKENPRCLVWIPSRMEMMVALGNGTIVFWDTMKGQPLYVLRADVQQLTQLYYDDTTKRLITTSKGKLIKVLQSITQFWKIPDYWRDNRLIQREQQEMAIQRRVNNAVKIKQLTKRIAIDSDEDDLTMWHRQTSSQESEDEL